MKYNVVINKAALRDCLTDSFEDFTRMLVKTVGQTGCTYELITDTFETLPEGGFSFIGDLGWLNKFDAAVLTYLGAFEALNESLSEGAIQEWLSDTKLYGPKQWIQLFELAD